MTLLSSHHQTLAIPVRWSGLVKLQIFSRCLRRAMATASVRLVLRFAENFDKTTPVRGALDGEIRIQGYMQAEFAHIGVYLVKPEMELSRGFSDFCLFPDPVHGDFVHDSYIIELKYSKPGATDAEIAAKAEEGIAQLRRYAADPTVPALSAGTRLHLLLYQFKGTELIRLEEIA